MSLVLWRRCFYNAFWLVKKSSRTKSQERPLRRARLAEADEARRAAGRWDGVCGRHFVRLLRQAI